MSASQIEADDITDGIGALIALKARLDTGGQAGPVTIAAVEDLVFVDDNRLVQPVFADIADELVEVQPFD
jgi:hypothetical protein